MPIEFEWTVEGTEIPSEPVPGATAGALFGLTALRDKALDPVTGDLLQSNGDQVFNAGTDGIVSDLLSRLQTFAQEVFLDTSIGVDYQNRVLVRFPDTGAIRAMFAAEILDCPGIVEILRLVVELETAIREASISFEARADTGDVISRTLTLDFTAGT